MVKIKRFYNTLRYLKPVQIYGRLWFYLYKPRPDTRPRPEVRMPTGEWLIPVHRQPSLLGPKLFRFLNEEHEILKSSDWNDTRQSKLWLYNLHYFNDLNASGFEERKSWHEDLIEKWINENPPGAGNGWEPYPITLRIVNWIKWIFSGNNPPENMKQSMATQARYLAKKLEVRLLGNHLLANGKTLLFAGCYFKGPEANRWRSKGTELLLDEFNEQILPDGGHFERSPMYHCIVLEDALDCLNLLSAYGLENCELGAMLRDKATVMTAFLADILHPDLGIPFFNDSAFNISPSWEELSGYAERLGISPVTDKISDNIIEKQDFGLWVLKNDDMHLIVDAGAIGPDYQPGHAHCDTLSYEMSVAGKRFIVNSGTYTYKGPERHLFRSTESHNTVRLDGEEQHEIWANFRVARRGYPTGIRIENSAERLQFEAAHTGYKRLKGKPLHRRIFSIAEGKVIVKDIIEGAGDHRAESFIHLHPDVEIVEVESDRVKCALNGQPVTIKSLDDIGLRIDDSYFSLEFGKKVKNKVIVIEKRDSAPFSMAYEIRIS